MIGMRVTTETEKSDQYQFEHFYKRHLRAVQAVVGRYRFTDAAADDLVQDIFAAAWEKKDSMRNPDAMSGWLMAIARNSCLSELRKKKNFISIAPCDSYESGDEDAEWEVVLQSGDENATRNLEFSLSLITQIIRTHKHGARAQIARLYYEDGLSVMMIAEKLELNQNTVLSHLRRFRLVATKAMLALMDEHQMIEI